MRTQVDFEGAVGKTIEAFVHPEYDERLLLVTFQDGSFLQMEISGGGEWFEIEAGGLFDRRTYSRNDMLRLGFITQEEVDQEIASEAAATAEWEKRQEAVLRQQYEQLRARFEVK